MALTPFHVDASDPTRAKVFVDGEPVPALKRVSMDWSNGEVPHLYLELLGEGEVKGEGIVIQQMPAPPADLVAVLGEFLDAIDPKVLEAEMLNEFGDGADTTTGQAAIAVLKRWTKTAQERI